MKPSFLSRFSRKKRNAESPSPRVATADDIRKKLEHYQKKEGPANFGSAGLYYVNEVDDDLGPEIVKFESIHETET